MTWSVSVVVVVAFGLVHLALGWLLGRSWPFFRTASNRPSQRDAQELRRAAQRLSEQVVKVHRGIRQHQGQLHEVNHGLIAARSEETGSAAESVLASVARILGINARLQEQLQAAEDKLHEQGKQLESWMAEARTDPLTGLPNRRAFTDALEQQVAQWRRKKLPFSVVVVDVDHFKRINDQHGHPVGDLVLRLFAEVLEGTFRKMDLISRIGGEEFAAILPSTPGFDACRAAEHCRRAIASHEFCCDDLRLRITASLGVAFVDSRDDAGSLIRRADLALYAAKQAGRNRIHLHNGSGTEPVDLNAAPGDSPSPRPDGARGTLNAAVLADRDCVELGASLRNRLAEIAGQLA